MTLTTLKRWSRCCRKMWSKLACSDSARQATKSPTDMFRAAKLPERTTHFRSAAETTLLATTPPMVPESSRKVMGQMVRPSFSMIPSALSSGSSCCTETCRMVPRRSKTFADRDFSTAVGAEHLRARFRKSKDENTVTISPSASTKGTRRTGRPFLFPAINRITSRSGVATFAGTYSQNWEQLAMVPTLALQIRLMLSATEPKGASCSSLWLMSM
mmetsp:Transcript_81170/g.194787  ORF Transcript_81170/g.194787 Transcript_81170/m.194787 type:complete len:215 (-) Transcript_81170:1677-2321(-)